MESGPLPSKPDERPRGLVEKILLGLRRDANLTITQRLRKGVRLLWDTARAPIALRHCTVRGKTCRVHGQVIIENHGTIRLGSNVDISGLYVPSELIAGPKGTIEIGNNVRVNYGTVISASKSVRIGSGVHMGTHCIISDLDMPEDAVTSDAEEAKAITIGNRVWLAGRVTIRPGVTIGDDAVIMSGSIVETDIPDGAVAGGIPARVREVLAEKKVEKSASFDTQVSGGAGVSSSVSSPTVTTLTAPVAGSSAGDSSKADSVVPGQMLSGVSVLLISDFTVDELIGELARPGTPSAVEAKLAPFGQVVQTLLGSTGGGGADFGVVWTLPNFISAFARISNGETVSDSILAEEVDGFVNLLRTAAPSFGQLFVPTWSMESWRRGLGVRDCRPGGLRHALTMMNLRLMTGLEGVPNVQVLDAERWFHSAGQNSVLPRGWYHGKVYASRPVIAEAALDIRAAIAASRGSTSKLLVLDLDNTLWGGVVGDVGTDGLRLGGHDAVGEAFVEFQHSVKALKSRGIVLAVASKNEESNALDAIRNHPNMVLREDDFVARRIDWNDKAANIEAMSRELNLGLQSVVFLDDNPIERNRVRTVLPEVYVPELPEDPLLYRSFLENLRCFDSLVQTGEDVNRTELYVQERKRQDARSAVGTIDDWLASLETVVRIEVLGSNNLQRAAQLLNKTNQMNLTTRRLQESDYFNWSVQDGNRVLAFSVRDKFGDAGLTGLLGLERQGNQLAIIDFVLSCRVMGRRVEETLIHVAVREGIEMGVQSVVANYLPTAKNKPCLTFFQNSAFTENPSNSFHWDASTSYPLDPSIRLEDASHV